MAYDVLPTELWLEIASYLSKFDCVALVHVSKQFSARFIPILYSNVVIRLHKLPELAHTGGISEPYIPSDTPTGRLLRHLDADPELSGLIRHIKLQHQSRQWSKEMNLNSNLIFDTIFRIIARCPNLRSVSLSFIDIHVRWIYHLACLPGNGLSLELYECGLHGDLAPQNHLFTVSALRANADVGSYRLHKSISSITFGGTLEHISTDLRINWLASLHQECGAPSLPLLKSLITRNRGAEQRRTLTSRPSEPTLFPSLLRATPQLLQLEIHQLMKDDRLDLSQLVQHLQYVDIPLQLIPAFTAGRPVRSVLCRAGNGDDQDYDYSQLGPRFGSTLSVQSIMWGVCPNPLKFLDCITKHHLHLLHLSVIFYRFPQSLRDAMQEWMVKLSLLKELQTLVIKISPIPSPPLHEWERSQCELLHSTGSPDLALVSLNRDVVWKRHPSSLNWMVLENETAFFIHDYVARRMCLKYEW